MIETWRWFGPSDSITLEKIRQAGATGIVTALHEIPTGDVWPLELVKRRKAEIAASGMNWDVIESIPVHNDIKSRTGDYKQLIENYKQSIRNVGAAGVTTVCYNFMPVVDWTRTNLTYQLPDKSYALRFEYSDFAAYDVFVMQRQGAEKDYTPAMLEKAKARFDAMSEEERVGLEKNIIAGLPGGEGSYDREGIRDTIQQFIDMGEDGLRTSLYEFLEAIIPVAEEAGVKMCIHPDDPPFSLFGLPRVVSTQSDAERLLKAVDSPANGLTMCAGSYGARGDNDLIAMVNAFKDRIYFVHLRNVTREEDGSFYEAAHLDGDNDMVGLVQALLNCESSIGCQIPMRPDHGHTLSDEQGKEGLKPGYSYLGRLKGLAELRGLIRAVSYMSAR
ncbi:mannonate dehydratase [Alteromonas confluentis]|uniref:Mannonate dehydratase n=1 Tax=Alteromonas confluentis TaxID=1656094 RepID=A0A1E7Z9U8_9ALTE|nr:mannonate dehydratase [Alteromonas confluentis]OFC70305.1 mannonate dehydratase [Alteromonas confluentis]